MWALLKGKTWRNEITVKKAISEFQKPHFQNEPKFQTFLVIMSFICMKLKKYFHINGSALSLSLKQRLEATRKWPFYWQITVIGSWQIQNKIDLSEVLWARETEQPPQTIVFTKTAGNRTSPGWGSMSHSHNLFNDVCRASPALISKWVRKPKSFHYGYKATDAEVVFLRTGAISLTTDMFPLLHVVALRSQRTHY